MSEAVLKSKLEDAHLVLVSPPYLVQLHFNKHLTTDIVIVTGWFPTVNYRWQSVGKYSLVYFYTQWPLTLSHYICMYTGPNCCDPGLTLLCRLCLLSLYKCKGWALYFVKRSPFLSVFYDLVQCFDRGFVGGGLRISVSFAIDGVGESGHLSAVGWHLIHGWKMRT